MEPSAAPRRRLTVTQAHRDVAIAAENLIVGWGRDSWQRIAREYESLAGDRGLL